MRFTNPFAFILAFLYITTIAVPLSPPTNGMRSVGNALDVRQIQVISDGP
jgi:hypothetical protein